jgi:cytochrome c2
MKKFSARRLLIVSAWLITMVGALGAGAYGHKYRAQIRAMFSSVQAGTAITTNLQMLKVEKLASPAEGRDGGLAAFNGGLLVADRTGRFWFIDAAKAVRALSVQAPANVAEFDADPFNSKTILRELFGVKDIAVQTLDGGVRLLVSHNHWNRAQKCNTLRVSSLETTTEKLLAGGPAAGTWRTIFETTPCRPLEKTADGGQRAGLGVGGRIEPLPDGGILLTVGGFDPENELVLRAPQKLDNTYGKTVRIDPASGEYRVFTIGHRNPQGLAVASNGQIWLTEHAARGGDELNLLGDKKNYGYPLVAYGTQYDAMTWPLSKQQGRHDGFEKPMFVWTPSIGISQLIVLEKSAFPDWRGDLVVGSLGGQALFRVRVEDGRVIFAEPIPVAHRVRDLVEASDGSIVLKTDDSFIVFLSPLNAATAATSTERGAMLASSCQSCHAITADGGARIGPTLWKIVGRPVATSPGFNYSAALKAVDGRWTPETLRRFLANPNAFAPGTSMQLGNTYTDAQIGDLIEYLQGLK